MPRILPLETRPHDKYHPLQYEIVQAMEKLLDLCEQWEDRPKPAWTSFDHSVWFDTPAHLLFQLHMFFDLFNGSIPQHKREAWERRQRRSANAT